MEKPSANRFAKPRIRMIADDREAPTAPATIAKVVIVPSMLP